MSFGWGSGVNGDEGLETVGKVIVKTSPYWIPVGGGYWLYKQMTDPTASGFVQDITNGMITAGGLGITGMASYLAVQQFYHKKRAQQEYRYVRITPHANTKTEKESIDHLMKAFWRSQRSYLQRLIRGREWFQLLICCEEGNHEQGDISFYIGFPQDRWTFLTNTLKATYPTSETTNVRTHQIPIFSQEHSNGIGRVLTFRSRKQSGFPLQVFDGSDKIARIIDHMESGTTLAVTFSPTHTRRLKSNTRKTRNYLYQQANFDPKKMNANELDPDVQDELKQLKSRERSNQYPFEVSIAIYDQAGNDYTIESITNAINAAVATQNSLAKAFTLATQPIKRAPHYLHIPFIPDSRMVMTGNELANLLHLPNGKTKQELADNRPHVYDRIPHIQQGQSLLPPNEFASGIYVGQYINPAQGFRSVYIDPDQLRNHGTLLGKTGSGKTALALEITTYLLSKKMGFTVIDPKATFAQNLLTRINKLKLEGVLDDADLERIHYFDIKSQDYSFGINPLQRPGGKPPNRTQAEIIIDRTLDVFKSAWASESILFERFGRLLLKALLADPAEQHTILALPEMLREESTLRARLIATLKNSDSSYAKEIARDLEEEESKGSFSNQKTDALVNRLVRIKESAILRHIFGQKKTTIHPLKWMNEGHTVLFNVEGLSEDQITILMGYILYEYHAKCRKRSNPSENHYMVIDEAHNVKNLDVIHRKIIPEDREFGLSLLLMTQMLHQFPAPFFDALTEVAGTYMSCEVGAENARLLEKITQKRISAETVQGLKQLTAVIDAADSQKKRVSFVVKSAPPIIYHKDGTPTYYGEDGERTSREKEQALADGVRLIGIPLMERDCMPNDRIEKEIEEYIASLIGEKEAVDAEALIAAANTPKKVRMKKKPSKRLVIKKKGGEAGDNVD